MRRSGLLTVALALLATAVMAPAAHADLLAAEDQAELAQLLADATEEQGVCYGWHAQVSDPSGGESSDDTGSSFGPDTALQDGDDADQCSEVVELEASLYYTSSTSEAEDSASVTVRTSSGSISFEDVERLGYDEGDLLGDKDDLALFNMVAGLPLLAAEAGLADPIPLEPPSEEELEEAANEAPTNSPRSDWWRMYWWVPVLLVPVGGILLLVLIGWAIRLKSRLSTSRHDRTP